MTKLNLSSVGVTLGGLLTLQGLTYVLTDNKTIGYPNIAVALELNAPIGGLISVRSAACLAVFVLAALVMTYTHIGRDVIATGSDRRAARIAGPQHRSRRHRRVRRVRHVLGARRRAAELQPRRRVAGGAGRRAGDGGGRRHRRRRVGGRRPRQPDGDRGGRADAVRPALGPVGDRRRAGCARSRHRLYSDRDRVSRCAGAVPPGDILASRPRRAQGARRNVAMTDAAAFVLSTFVPLPDRAPLKFPGGARVALIFTINIEYWEPFRAGQKEPLFPGGPATIPHALPGDVLDTANWTWREYGQRVGIWRLMDVFDAMGVAPSCTCNGLILVERRRIIDAVKERGWELVPHNWAQNDLLTYYAHNPDEERAVIRTHAR